ncbi:MAG: hypothetical protein ABI863_18260 [Ginsengibacter sp.]
MKQAMQTTRMITMGLFTLCVMGLSQATFAGSKTDSPIELKFIGKVDSHPVFQLNLNNQGAEEYFISIRDEHYNSLFSEKVRANEANFARKYRLDITEDDLNAPGFGVIVEVTSTKTHKTQVYKISTQRTVTENITVGVIK